MTRHDIRFQDVQFGYGGEQRALHGITLEVPDGHTVALVGPSGAGKSTLLNLIPRFYEVSGGAVLIGGTDIRDVTLSSLRGNIALVSQEITLFDELSAPNIAYGRVGATEEESSPPPRAAAHDFIMELPDCYDRVVGEIGSSFRRPAPAVSIARAMLRNAPILLLDEATSALDTELERVVQGALKALQRGRTTLVVAHRLSTIVDADRIYVSMPAGWRSPGRMASCSGAMASMRSCGGCRAGLPLRMWRLPLRWRCDKISNFFSNGGLFGGPLPLML